MHQAISILTGRIIAFLADGIHLGRISNIHIHIDLSWVVVFAFVAYLNSSSFARLHPQWAPHRDWIMAAFASLLFWPRVSLRPAANWLVFAWSASESMVLASAQRQGWEASGLYLPARS